MEHLLLRWAALGHTARLQHVFLPADPEDAYEALLSLHVNGHPGGRHYASEAEAGEYDHARLHDLAANEGFSHHPLHGAAPASGYMASYDAPEGSGQAVVHHITSLTAGHIAEHRHAISEHLAKPDSYQGGWHDTSDGNVYLDASRHHADELSVRKFAGEQQQKAYFKLDDFTERYMDPHHDPLAMKDQGAWKHRYSDVGTAPHSAWSSYSHRYPPTEDQKHFWAEQGHHLAGKGAMTGRPVGPWLSDRFVEQQEAARRHRGWPL
jgi:hypothetical protein